MNYGTVDVPRTVPAPTEARPGMRPRATLCGSFRRSPEGLRADWTSLLAAGCEIVSPRSLEWVREERGFVFGPDEFGLAPQEIEDAHLAAMRSSDFVWLHCPGGYVGQSASMELGYARALGLRVFARELPEDVTLRGLVARLESPAAAVEVLRSGRDAPGEGLGSLQSYYRRAAVARGWGDEDAQQCLRLLTAELEELRAAVDGTDSGTSEAALEMADVQLYLVHLANIMGIDLGQAVVEKERVNASRFGPAVPGLG